MFVCFFVGTPPTKKENYKSTIAVPLVFPAKVSKKGTLKNDTHFGVLFGVRFLANHTEYIQSLSQKDSPGRFVFSVGTQAIASDFSVLTTTWWLKMKRPLKSVE